MPSCPASSDIVRALGVLGHAWTRALPQPTSARKMVSRMRPREDGLWQGVDTEIADVFPAGLTLAEALGLTLSATWLGEVPGAGLQIGWPGPRLSTLWSLTLPVRPCNPLILGAAEALPIVRALQTIRRSIRPPVPWGPRDQVAQELERTARAMEAELRGRPTAQTLRPETIESDLGRDWSGRYQAQG